MNKFVFSENLVKMRHKKKITQEQLADFLGVTKASVSQWERGNTLPDIQILPLLASYFDTTLDELLGYERILSKEQIKCLYHRLAEDFAEKPFEEVMEESEELVKKYYSCYSFLQQIAVLWLNHAPLAPDPARQKQIRENIVDLCDRIIENCRDIGICNNAIAIKSMIDLQSGNAQKVIETMEEMLDVNRIEDKGILLTMAYMTVGDVENADKTAQVCMYRSLSGMLGFGLHLMMLHKADWEYSMEIKKRLDSVAESFQIEKLNPNTAASYHYQTAVCLCEFLKEEAEQAEEMILHHLEQYTLSAKRLLKEGIVLHGDDFFTKLDEWFEELDLGIKGVRSEKLVKESVLEGLNYPEFQKLSNQEKLENFRKMILS